MRRFPGDLGRHQIKEGGLIMGKTVEAINEKIASGTAVVLDAGEMTRLVAEAG